MAEREQWGSRIGLILAMAGNAIGLGNFLRFPVQAADNGGGAFMIPYFISLILLGIPLMWVEWGLGRYGGARGHGTAPGVFDAIWKHPIAKYMGILGIFLPLVVLVYYTYICSWTLAYSVSSLLHKFPTIDTLSAAVSPQEYLTPYANYLGAYIGDTGDALYLNPPKAAYVFFAITLILSMYILWKGISGGIEKFCNIALPAIFVIGAVLFVRVVTLDSPTDPSMTASRAFSFLWEPDFSGILNPKVWLAAAGQIFFTLSLGMGAIITYASYVKKDEDIVMDGIATAGLNEFAEVIYGSTIAIGAAVIFFGFAGAKVAAGGAFKLGFISMPAIFTHMPAGTYFGCLWFFLLFLAGLTSVVALAQPAVAFLEDELGFSRHRSVITLGIFFAVSVLLPAFVKGSLDELDFWAGTFGLVFLALFEVVLFFWVFGGENAWEEVNRGAKVRIPGIFYYVTKYITPLFILMILIGWGWQELPGKFASKDAGVWAARVYLIALLALHIVLVEVAWKRRRNKKS